MFEGDYAQYPGKLVRVRTSRGILKEFVGVFLSDDSRSIRLSELYSYGHFRVRTIPKGEIAWIQTIDLATGEWPTD